jgi:hypothetical protein
MFLSIVRAGSRYYQAIYRCNVLLQNIDQVTWGDSIALKKQYTAEAKFIRAYCYFDMVRLWEKFLCLQHLPVPMCHNPIRL